ncbi:MAG TPA: HAMP domain-containing sensor histidine kinase [Kofleriaceae bacterium]|jgi:signal transduction histidine kinase
MTDELARLHALATAGALAAGAVHETRNLLTGILGFAQVAKERAGGSTTEVQRIERDAIRCLDVLERFLSLARVPDEPVTAIDLGELVEDVAASLEPELARKYVALHVNAPRDLPTVDARRGELHRAVLNLAMNAVHAAPRAGDIVVALATSDGAVELAVADSGSGVPPELRERIFEPFFTTKSSGTGLGLALCRASIERVGGTLVLDGTHAPGARFVMRLPATGGG